jgi:predicted ABC-type ATPase
MGEANPQVVIIAGPNGAGKSTLAPFLLRDKLKLLEYVNADPIALGLSGFDPGSVSLKAGRVMMKRLRELAKQNKTFAFETTLAARSYAAWINKLRGSGYNFQLSFLWLRSPDLAVHRVRERVRSGGHDVDEGVIRRRYEAGLKNFWTLYQPLAEAWSVYDNSASTEPVAIATGGGNRVLRILEESAWARFSESRP